MFRWLRAGGGDAGPAPVFDYYFIIIIIIIIIIINFFFAMQLK